MQREVGYEWRLREVMAAHGMYQTSDLVAPLAERGINLSVSQVHRLVSGKPERLSLPVLAAVCDIFACTPADLITTSAEDKTVRRTGTDTGAINLNAKRPTRARLRPDS
ncbi:DNA-binding Xre family transcriptional regulator [Saccharopolyspora erythraea NRRL 2338]|uniref:HTH cro/C1-type domain-containing protein n=2 Tax=Saccharopolyspora erythraea TaxID=1836 RepID=A4FC48_SACEN|nr:helix-turn-helix transcriptional regulator [Saccharopolyspora erythraea]EQD82341.1 Cro/Cl family transcriptional regulator [Saccharopolyspora erythraea D]PFG95391.1 DNA-binding Xre family transcriptional regulator [Saccharopolyspora erythraea NRRL 2338]QRK92030.1 helix-turn-helix transcriptional regulator [Saccharopolyspora erythraea]CAM01623.1 hypothetical protein SACE_2323 [Saccharopolyspora erythraea NRRL 2338]